MENKQCQNCKQTFAIEPDDFSFYAKMDVPPPVWCPECRQMRRMLFRNFKTLYKRPSSKSGKSVVSIYSPEFPSPVYEVNEWWADDWDALDAGQDIDFARPFFDQVKEVQSRVPRMSMMNTKSENCEYSNQIIRSARCYLLFGGLQSEDCDYGHIVWNSKDSLDNLYIFKSEFCYECIDCSSCHGLLYSQECEACADSIALFDCRGCTDCIGCVGLRNKSNYIFNQRVSKEEYKAFLEKYPLSDPESIAYIKSQMEILKASVPVPEMFGSRNVDVSGNHIYNSHNIHNAFDIEGGENSKFGYTVRTFTNSYDVSFTADVENVYECLNCIGSNMIGCHIVMDSTNAFYSDTCYGCHDIFGCAGLRQKSYCILNKQYTKEEYEILKAKLVEHMKLGGEWGYFPPASLSPFAYNESIVNEYMPKTREEVLALGFTWKDDISVTKGQETIASGDLPKNPKTFDASLLAHILKCSSCDKNYRLIDREISFYQHFGLPIPEKCFNCRHTERMQKRNPRVVRDSSCAKCGQAIKTSYQADYPSQVFCTSCYQQEIV